jgi:hypothetical protein
MTTAELKTYYCLMSLDLDRVNGAQRVVFYKFLEDHHWTKLRKVDTVWTCRFKPTASKTGLRTFVTSRLREGAEFAGISEMHADFLLSTSRVRRVDLPGV